MLDKGMVHVLGRKKRNRSFHCTTQNSTWFKTYKLFISGFPFNGQLRVTKTVESKTIAESTTPMEFQKFSLQAT